MSTKLYCVGFRCVSTQSHVCWTQVRINWCTLWDVSQMPIFLYASLLVWCTWTKFCVCCPRLVLDTPMLGALSLLPWCGHLLTYLLLNSDDRLGLSVCLIAVPYRCAQSVPQCSTVSGSIFTSPLQSSLVWKREDELSWTYMSTSAFISLYLLSVVFPSGLYLMGTVDFTFILRLGMVTSPVPCLRASDKCCRWHVSQ